MYTIHEMIGMWLVREDGKHIATCPSEDAARRIAAAMRLADDLAAVITEPMPEMLAAGG